MCLETVYDCIGMVNSSNGFMISLAKCNFLKLEVKMLGCMLGSGLVKPCHK